MRKVSTSRANSSTECLPPEPPFRSNPPSNEFCFECGHSIAEPAPAPAKPPPPEPTSFTGGRYQVKEFPGDGGKKKVYLAYDTVLDRDVAFALIKTEKLDEDARTRLKREAQAIGKLGDHPNIVTIYDMGEYNEYVCTQILGMSHEEFITLVNEGVFK